MKTNNLIVLFLFLISPIVFGQTVTEKRIHGKIIANSANVEGINVVNLGNEIATVTNSKGDFFISAKAGDLLVITAVDIEVVRRLIDEKDLQSQVLVINAIPKTNVLEEVIVDEKPKISAESLGIVSKNVKRYTPAERRLIEARALPINGLLNLISGRTAMLKKELKVEKKVMMLEKIAFLFEDKYYTETLRIPEEYIKGFQYYCVDDADFTAAVKAKNKTMAMFLIVQLAQNYIQIITKEKE